MRYHELTLTIQSSAAGGFRTTAQSDLFKGREEEPFEPPWGREELAAMAAAVEAAARREAGIREGGAADTAMPQRPMGRRAAGRKRSSSAAAEAPLPPSPEEAGRRLYEALFVGEVGTLLDRCLAAAAGQEGQAGGLRMRLVFDADEEPGRLAWLTALPWELLWSRARRGFLGRRRQTPVVRDLVCGQRARPWQTPLPLRILVVDSGATDLELHAELQRIHKALGDDPRFDLFHLERPTLVEVRSALRSARIHVLHYMGHGGFNDRSGRGGIFFVGPDGVEQTILGERLAEQLQDLPGLRLVVLNTCKSAMMSGPEGVASALLVGENPPAVIAMQYPVSDRAAIAFSQALYRSLALNDPLDVAVSEARLALSAQTSEWVSPVLYMPSADAVLFDFEGADEPPPTRVVRVRDLAVTPLHLGIHSIGEFGDLVRKDADRHLELEDRFVAPERRRLEEGRTWLDDLYEPLRRFLLDAARRNRPLLLDLAVHSTLAFAAGWTLPAKSGLAVTVRQRFQGGSRDWSPEDGSAQEDPLWQSAPERPGAAAASDVSLAMGVTRDVTKDIAAYLDRSGIAVRRILSAVIAPEPGPRSVAGGAHVLQLARRLASWVQERTPEEREGVLHVFGSAPNALWFALGQVLRGSGTVQLYEHDFDAARPFAAYTPSLRLPPAG